MMTQKQINSLTTPAATSFPRALLDLGKHKCRITF